MMLASKQRNMRNTTNMNTLNFKIIQVSTGKVIAEAMDKVTAQGIVMALEAFYGFLEIEVK